MVSLQTECRAETKSEHPGILYLPLLRSRYNNILGKRNHL